MKYRCLTKDDRIKIEVLLKAGVKVAKIAEELGFHYSSIYREIKKGLYSIAAYIGKLKRAYIATEIQTIQLK